MNTERPCSAAEGKYRKSPNGKWYGVFLLRRGALVLPRNTRPKERKK